MALSGKFQSLPHFPIQEQRGRAVFGGSVEGEDLHVASREGGSGTPGMTLENTGTASGRPTQDLRGGGAGRIRCKSSSILAKAGGQAPFV